MVGDLYIANIKQFKPTPLSQKEIDAAVPAFKLPSAAKVPESEISTEAVAEYESSAVEIDSAPVAGEAPVEEDWFVFEEAPKEAH